MSADLIAAYPVDHPRAWRSILAELRPDETGVLRSTYGRETVDELGAREGVPLRVITFEAWREGAAAAQRAEVACWVETDRERYTYALEVLPPAAWDGRSFLVSEPVDHDFTSARARFHGYRERGSELHRVYDATSRPVTVAELKANRDTPRGVPWAPL
jgi:hypothetical protein